jgi:NTE family protein
MTAPPGSRGAAPVTLASSNRRADMGFTPAIRLDDITLVLGGGGGRGLAHIGAWRALQEIDIRPVRLVASSAGALIGACIASGASWQEMSCRAQLLAGGIFSLNSRILSQGMRTPSLLREEPLRELIHSLTSISRFDELPVRLSVNSVDLGTGRVVWFGEGGREDVSLAEAIYASCALPLFFPPATIGGEHYVDGGILDPLPIAHARSLGARSIIAIDLAAPAPPPQRRPGMIDTYCRVFEILGERGGRSRAGAPQRDVIHILPSLSGRHTFDLSRPETLIEAGYHATLKALTGYLPAFESAPAAAAPVIVRPAAAQSRWLPSWLLNVPATLGRMVPSR